MVSNFEEAEKNSSSVRYIGLASATDFGYAFPEESCKLLSISSDCKKNNWLLHDSDGDWIITPISSQYSNKAMYIMSISFYVTYIDDYRYRMCPTMYLKSEVKIISGEGMSSNPYLLSI